MNKDEKQKQENIKVIIELLTKEAPDKVLDILVFIQNYLSK